MAKYRNEIEYGISTKLDDSGLRKLQTQLDAVKQKLSSMAKDGGLDKATDTTKAIENVNRLQKALQDAYNPKFGTVNSSQLLSNLGGANGVTEITSSLSKAGVEGAKAMNNVIAENAQLQTGLKQTATISDKMWTSLQNIMRWQIGSQIVNSFVNSFGQAYGYVKDLDDSLTQIMLVTDYSRQEMDDYAQSANEAAKALGTTTTAMTNATLIFAQQGFDINQSSQLAQYSNLLANASQQDTATTSDQITAYMNAYGLEDDMDGIKKALDSWAEVANISAADVGEIAEASQRVASTAATTGVNMDQLNAQIATIESVTREAPEQIGNGLKTLYARFSDLQMGKTLDDNVDLGKVTSQLQAIGVQVMNGDQMRNVGDIMEDLMSVWQDLDQTQKAAVAQTVAGKYQLSRFEALMNRSDLYNKYKEGSENAQGTMDLMNEKYIDSLQGRLNKIQATVEGIINDLMNSDDLYPFIDGAQRILDIINGIAKALGGISPIASTISAIVLNLVRNQAANVIGQQLYNIKDNAGELLSSFTEKKTTNKDAQTLLNEKFGKSVAAKYSAQEDQDNIVYQQAKFMTQNQGSMSEEQRKQANKNLDNALTIANNYADAKDKLEQAKAAAEEAGETFEETKQKVNDATDKVNENSKAVNKAADATANAEDELVDASQAQKEYVGSQQEEDDDFSKVIKLTELSDAKDKAEQDYETAMNEYKAALDALKTAKNDADKASGEEDAKAWKELANEAANERDALQTEINNVSSEKSVVDQRVDNAIKKLEAAEQAREAAQKNLEVAQQNKDASEKEKEAAQQAKDAADAQVDAAQSELDAAQAQVEAEEKRQQVERDTQKITNVVNGALAVGDVTAAVSSFNSLGQSIGNAFSDKNASMGEKIAGVVANSVTTFISAAFAVQSLSDAFDINAKSAIRMTATIGITVAAIQALVTAQEQQRTENVNNAVDDYNDVYKKASIDTSSFDEAYKQYQETGKASDELKNASKQLAEQLDVTGGSAMADAGNFDKLKNSIDAAKKSAQDMSATQAETSLGALNNDVGTYTLFDLNDAQHQLMSMSQSSRFQQDTGITQNTWTPWASDTSGMDIVQKLGAVNNELVDVQKNVDEAQSKLDSMKPSDTGYNELKSQLDSEKQYLQDIQSYASNEDYTQASTILKEAAETQIQQIKDTASSSFEGIGEEAATALLTDRNGSYSAIADYYASLGNEAGNEYMQNLLSSLNAYNAEDLMKQQADALKSNFSNSIDNDVSENWDNPMNDSSGIVSQLQNAGITQSQASQYTTQISDALTQTVMDQVANSGLSSEDQQELLNGLDWSKPIDEVLGQVSQSIATNNDFEDFGEYQKTEESEDQSRTKHLTDDYKIDEDTIDTYRELMDAETKLGDQTDELTKSYKDAADHAEDVKNANGEDSDAYKEAAKAADKAKASLDSYTDTQNDLADMSIQSQKGMEALSESIGDNAKMLREGDKTSLEYAQAMDDVRTQVADLVNVSKEDITPQFVTDNLDDIEKAADGDTDALGRLRAAAADAIVQEAYMDGNLTPEHMDYLEQKATELSSQSVEMGAYLDDTDFINTLNNMLASGEMTAEQVQEYLNAIGYKANISYITTDGGSFTVHGQDIPINVLGVDVASIKIPDMTVTSTIKVPQIDSVQSGGTGSYSPAVSVATGKGKKSSGGGVSSGKKSSRGGGGGGGSGKKGGGSSSPRKSSGDGGGSSGKSSGSGSSYTPKTKDEEKDEVNRYERVDTLLEDVDKNLERLRNDQDRLVGKQLLENMEKQIPLYEKQIALEKQKLEIQRQEAKELRDQLSNKYKVTFDSEGFISNYAERHDALLNHVNNLIAQYNAATTESAQDALEKQIEDAKDDLSDFNDTYKRYDELWGSDITDTKNKIEDLNDSIEDLAIDAFKKSAEALDNIKDIKDTWAEFQHNMHRGIDDNPFDELADSAARLNEYFDLDTVDNYFDNIINNYKKMKDAATTNDARNYFQNQIDTATAAHAAQGQSSVELGGSGYLDMALTNLNAILDQINQYENSNGEYSSIFGQNGADLYDEAKTIYEQVTKIIADLWDQVDDVHDKIMDCIDDITDRLEKQDDKFNQINDQLEHLQNVAEYIYGDEAYEQQNKILAAQYQNYQNQLAYRNAEKDFLQNQMDELEKAGRKFTADGKHYTKEYQTLLEQLQDVTSNINETIENSLESLQKQYENTVNKITNQDWIHNIFGDGKDLDWIKTEWDLINRNADYYLDDTNKAYNIQKLQGKYLDLLDNTPTLANQRKITDQMNQQLKYLREKTNLSEYDVKYAQAQLDILQKQIALQDAQNNKNQMKLRRDTQGNYSYVYTSDQDNVRSAQEDLLDANNNAYNLSLDQEKQTQDDSLSALTDAQNTINDIWTNGNLTLEQKTERTKEIIDSLKEYLAATSEQLSTSQKNIINDFIGMCDSLTDENKEGLKDIYDQIKAGNNDTFNSIDKRWSTSLTSWLKNLDKFNSDTDNMFKNLQSNGESYQKAVESTSGLLVGDYNSIDGAIKECTDATHSLAQETSDFIKQLENDSGIINDYEGKLVDMTSRINDAENAMRAYQQQTEELQNKLTQKEQENAQLVALNQQLQNRAANGGNGSGSGSGSGGSGGNSEGDAFGIAQNIWTYGSWANDPIRRRRIISRYGEATANRAQQIVNEYVYSGRANQLINWDSKKYGYDTGGYTGDWSDTTGAYKNGKLAFLHQKEIVLNKDDTSNILEAVNVVRGMINGIKGGFMQEAADMANQQFGNITQVDESQDINQEVHITATFPNATSTEEIENAILGLNDRSMQYAFKARNNN